MSSKIIDTETVEEYFFDYIKENDAIKAKRAWDNHFLCNVIDGVFKMIIPERVAQEDENALKDIIENGLSIKTEFIRRKEYPISKGKSSLLVTYDVFNLDFERFIEDGIEECGEYLADYMMVVASDARNLFTVIDHITDPYLTLVAPVKNAGIALIKNNREDMMSEDSGEIFNVLYDDLWMIPVWPKL